ncbi:MAG TPA: TetR family transcriptional regulator [Gaiellaceae bacterium]|nr:TetR family transcriptional regulator [Gaiellaceae bacterium]
MGLRETKKLATRQHIADVAMGLFAARGFDHVTVAEIATEAGVSDKTVFNYFPTKEDLFFDDVPDRLRALTEAIERRGDEETMLEALRRLQLRDVERLTSPGFAHFARVIESSPALQAKEVDVMAGFAQVLAEALQREGVRERDARIASAMVMAVHRQYFRAARREALAGRHGAAAARRLRADVIRAFELLEHGLAAVLP